MSETTFEQHVVFLKRHFTICHPDDELPLTCRKARDRVLLTFDDGLRNNAEIAAPILRKHDVPAIFFVSSRHHEPDRLLFFSYIRALRCHFRANGFTYAGEFWDMSDGSRVATIRRLWDHLLSLTPHPSAMYDVIENHLPPVRDFVEPRTIEALYAGMAAEQVAELAADRRFYVAGHTVDHPFLTRCDPAEVHRQIVENKQWLERVSGRPCRIFSYPLGDYDQQVLASCRAAGFDKAFAVAPRFEKGSRFEIERAGVFGQSTSGLGFRVRYARLCRRLGLELG